MSNGDTQTDVVGAGDRAVTQPADRALGYGDTAVAQGKKPSKPPATKPPPLTRLQLAEQALVTLAKGDSRLANVRVHDWTAVPNQVVRANEPKWSAWTNSKDDIYINPNAEFNSAVGADVTMFHETRHALDFVNGVPSSYHVGMLSEINAQRESVKYIDQRLKGKGLSGKDTQTLKNLRTGMNSWIKAQNPLLRAYDNEPDKTKAELELVKAWVALGYLPSAVLDNTLPQIAIKAPALYRP